LGYAALLRRGRRAAQNGSLISCSYGTNTTAFKEFLVNYHEVFKLNIWVTEWACQNMQGPQNQCSMSDVTEFMQETQEFMNQMEWVERYAWYGAKTAADMHGVNIVRGLLQVNHLCFGH
jgi:hypothetical protein